MSADAIVVEGLTKFYGKQRGVVDLSFSVRQGEIFGYLGPNGAGKTTTIRTLLDFIRATSGRATAFGLDSHRDSVEIHRRTGYLPGELGLYGNLTGEEYLRYMGSLRGGTDEREVRRLIDRLDLDLSQRIGALSHGNKQKLGLVQAFMHSPELLLLDEPSLGLDPLVQQEFYRLLLEAREEGRTVFLSSHVLPEVERVCDRVGIIREGRLVAVEDIEDLKRRALQRLEIRFAESPPPEAFQRLAGVRDVVVDDAELRCTVVGELDPLVKAVARFHVVGLVSEEPSLEEVFLTFYGPAPAGGEPRPDEVAASATERQREDPEPADAS